MLHVNVICCAELLAARPGQTALTTYMAYHHYHWSKRKHVGHELAQTLTMTETLTQHIQIIIQRSLIDS